MQINNPITLPWKSIETVLLDMDGTLLDLHFDNYFWAEYLPVCYSKKHAISLAKSKSLLIRYSNEVRGKLEWYCLDYWSNLLSLDIVSLKNNIGHKISFRTNTIKFLDFLKSQNKQIILATNAHPKALELKLLRADFSGYFDELSSSHEIGHPKEENEYWVTLTKQYSLKPKNCLFIDDSTKILQVAKQFGIGFVLGICQPDSMKEAIDCSPHIGIDNFNQLI